MSQKQPNNKNSSQNPVGRFMVAVGGIIELNDSGKILVVQRASNLDWQPNEWEITSGRIDQFEDPEIGLKRETVEETGLEDLEVIDILLVRRFLRGSAKIAENDLVAITYWCRTSTEEIRISAEHQGYKWATPEEALSLINIEGMKNDVRKFLRKREKF